MNYRRKIITSLLHQHNKWNKTAATLSPGQIDPDVIKTGNRCEFEEFIQAARQLQSEGFLFIKEIKHDFPKLIITDDTEIIVSYAKKEGIYTIDEYVRSCLIILEEFMRNDCPQIKSYCIEQINNLNNRKKVTLCPYNENINTTYCLRDILTGAFAVFNQTEDVLIRIFSSSVYGDSKKFANYIDKICKILAPEEIEAGIDCYTILNGYHIYQNPTEVTIKGNFKIEFVNGDILHGRTDSSLSFGQSFIKDVKTINIKNIISIENLTTYNMYTPKENELVIYLGGFANNITIDFIKKVLKPEMNYFHFGDIDAGGFNILLNLEEKIFHTVIPYKMSINELTEYRDFTKQLTSNDISKLKSIKTRDSRFDEVIDYMLKTNTKLEQESLDAFLFEY